MNSFSVLHVLKVIQAVRCWRTIATDMWWNCGILLLLSIQCVKTVGANRGVDLQTVTDEYVSTKLNEKVEICVQFDL